MTATSQDFTTYAGDDTIAAISVVDGSGNPIDLSTVQDVIWDVWSYPDHVVTLQKKKTGGQIILPSPPAGIVDVVITAADSDGLDGVYEHVLTVVDSFGKRSTVTEGLWTVLSRPADA